MPVPSSVKDLLDAQNVQYQIAALTFNDLEWQLDEDFCDKEAVSVKSVILKDGMGKVQVLYRSDCLLDLSVLNQQLVRQLKLANHNDLRSFYEQHQLETIPALPKLSGLPTVVDEGLMQAPSVLLDSGSCDQLVTMDQQQFKTIIHDASVMECCVPLETLDRDWEGEDDKQIINAVENFTNLRIQQRLEETLELPPLPSTAQRIIGLRVDPNADINDLATVVEMDPSLAAQVVSWAASPYYSAPGKIRSIHDAIVRVLGFDMVLNLSLGLALGKSMSMPKDYPQGVTSYWQQSVYTAAAVEALVSAIPREKRPSFGMAYLAGLLHNFGYLLLAEIFPPHFELINRHIEVNPHVPAHLIERHILGINREQLASWLMGLWHMPEEVVVALRYQNDPDYTGEHSAFSKLLYVANNKLRERGVGMGPAINIPDEIYKELHLTPDDAECAIENIVDSSEALNVIAMQMSG